MAAGPAWTDELPPLREFRQYLNGHEWAKRQLDKAGIGYVALDNEFRSCEDPVALQRICDRLGPGAVKSFLRRWQRRLPSPFTTADVRAGYVYDLAFRQLEVSDTCVFGFDRPQAGRAFFEGVIRDHLDLGRPDQVALLFDRKVTARTPGSFRTKVITKGVDVCGSLGGLWPVTGGVVDRACDEPRVGGVEAGERVAEVDWDSFGEAASDAQ